MQPSGTDIQATNDFVLVAGAMDEASTVARAEARDRAHEPAR